MRQSPTYTSTTPLDFANSLLLKERSGSSRPAGSAPAPPALQGSAPAPPALQGGLRVLPSCREGSGSTPSHADWRGSGSALRSCSVRSDSSCPAGCALAPHRPLSRRVLRASLLNSPLGLALSAALTSALRPASRRRSHPDPWLPQLRAIGFGYPPPGRSSERDLLIRPLLFGQVPVPPPSGDGHGSPGELSLAWTVMKEREMPGAGSKRAAADPPPGPPEKSANLEESAGSSGAKVETIKLGSDTSTEELDIRTLQNKNRKLAEVIDQRQTIEDELREQIEKLVKRQATDDATLLILNRYWCQDRDSTVLDMAESCVHTIPIAGQGQHSVRYGVKLLLLCPHSHAQSTETAQH
ncbi:uncharacterized protein LOC109925851 [Rhincodon typus]|uniref:uncharacterized protein LOC109925851 n=1 Tax=Rhincodon typus TaxID=259920 RepID=UPI00202DB7AD|nr:uncharacterized protein LOC109925851 [Rhincodon typus]